LISKGNHSISPEDRPPYIHQIPLNDIPGIGSKTLEKLLLNFGTEMNILHRIEIDNLKKVVNPQVATNIEKSRSGRLLIKPGGGGIYGKVMG
jgi:PHP family Zn ribbon phosphoesterase